MTGPIDKPGIANSGWMPDDFLETIDEAIAKVELILGPLTLCQKNEIAVVVTDYYHMTNAVQGGPVAATRKDLRTLENQCLELKKTLSKINRQHTARSAFNRVKYKNCEFAQIKTELEPLLKKMEVFSVLAARELPDKGTHFKKNNPEQHLIQKLYDFYTKFVGEKASAIRQDRTNDDEKYSGPFFEVIQAIYMVLMIEKQPTNSSLGKFIFEAIRE